MSELNDTVQVTVSDSEVITVPLDTTLSNSGEAAEAKAVGDALALKADRSELQAAISVDGQTADNQGVILVYGEHIPMSGTDERTVQAAISAAAARTGADIPISDAAGAPTIQAAIADGLAVTADEIPLADGSTVTVAYELNRLDNVKGNVQTVNGTAPGSNGNVQIEQVEYARNLVSTSSQQGAGMILERTSGGSATVKSGEAQVQAFRGVMHHDGVVQEVIDVVSSNDGLTLAVNEATLRTAMAEETSPKVFTYSGSAWDDTLGDYGITISSGTPEENDTITINYTAGSRGTITTATPTGFKATGYNLYQSGLGYARVIKYEYPYFIGGAHTAIAWSETPTGAQTALTENNGVFDIPADGYVHVTGGNATTTYVTTVWTDWTEGKDTKEPTAFETYTESGFDMSGLFGSEKTFEHGMTAVGNVYDEINFETGKAISRIERMAYSAENIAALELAGRAWEADDDYIYAVRTSTEIENHTTNLSDISSSLTGTYTVNDHGLEMITGSTVSVYIMVLYGNNLVRKLERDVLTVDQVANNLTTTDEGKVLDARQGKILKDAILTDAYTVKAYTGDVNNIGCGAVYTASSATHNPTAHNYYVMSYVYGTNSGFQIALRAAGTTAFFRIKSSNGWTAWKQFTLAS